jgi:hypothetical protein
MFGGIVLLLGQRPTSRRLQAMSLMLAAFVVLGLDAYLFGLVTGETAALCRRQWTEAMIAAGLLGVGAVAIICGLGLLLNSYICEERIAPAAGPARQPAQETGAGRPQEPGRAAELDTRDGPADGHGPADLDEPARLLQLLTSLLVCGVVFIVVFLETVTAEDYLNAVFNLHPPRWLADPVYGYGTLVLVGLVGGYLFKRRSPTIRNRPSDAGTRDGRATAPGKLLTVATVTAAAYAVLGTMLASLAASFPVIDWNPMRTWVAVGITAVSLLVPVPIFVAMANAVLWELTDHGPAGGAPAEEAAFDGGEHGVGRIDHGRRPEPVN